MKVNIQMHKDKLIVKGYRQRQVVDFDDTFLLVAMFKFTRIFLAITSYHDYEIWQIDIKVVFLNRNIHKNMYMTQPKGLNIRNLPTK
jgi:hypothetical protein